MKQFIVLCAFFAIITVVYSLNLAAKPEPIPILRNEFTKSDDGSYTFVYEAGDGTVREETGTVINPGSDDPKVRVSGRYKYIDGDGQEIVVEYGADENGFVPVGNNIAPEISDNAANAKNYPQEDQPVRSSQPFKSQAYNSQPLKSQPFKSQPFKSQPFKSQPFKSQPFNSQPFRG